MRLRPLRITDQSIKANWTLFIIILSYLTLILVRVWISVIPLNSIYVKGDLIPPPVLIKVEPVYPELAKISGITGEILIEVHTDRRGNVISTKVLNRASSYKDGF